MIIKNIFDAIPFVFAHLPLYGVLDLVIACMSFKNLFHFCAASIMGRCKL
jgi:hypothetical protein